MRVSISQETARLDNTKVSDGKEYHADTDILRTGEPEDVGVQGYTTD